MINQIFAYTLRCEGLQIIRNTLTLAYLVVTSTPLTNQTSENPVATITCDRYVRNLADAAKG